MKNLTDVEKAGIIEQIKSLLDRKDTEIFVQMDKGFRVNPETEDQEPTGAMCIVVSAQERPEITWSTDEAPTDQEVETVRELNKALKG